MHYVKGTYMNVISEQIVSNSNMSHDQTLNLSKGPRHKLNHALNPGAEISNRIYIYKTLMY